MATMTTAEKDKKLKEIITFCCQKELGDKQEVENILDSLETIYKDNNYRHRYDEITTIIISKHTNITKIGETDSLMIVSNNLSMICDMADKKKMDKDIFKKIEKLFIHTNLECVRLRSLDSNFNAVHKKINDYDEKINDIEKKEKDIKENLEKQQTQYITILGIFASIVLSFVGGLTFSTSVLSNIDKVSIYRLVFVISLIALFVGNILYYLFDFLSKITLKQNKEKCFFKRPIFYFNFVFLFIMLVVGIIYLINIHSHTNVFTQFLCCNCKT